MGWATSLAPLAGLRRIRHERPGFLLYGAAVAAARAPCLYSGLGVPDTLDGRFDLVGLHAVLLIERLRQAPSPGPALAQAVFDAMFSDMDVNLREMGVGDLSVGKKVKAMWNAFHGRAKAYAEPLAARDPVAMEAAITRNVWRAAPPPPGAAARLARLALAESDGLAGQTLGALAEGRVSFRGIEAVA
ncbi:MAG TPA: ubiquinol-cytochrome C chaperone family protein [Acetobacteraceae bacterium]|nr:ubiquinol-cytochrome C chaperone family protein [Acetobacteraceae bacterium]